MESNFHYTQVSDLQELFSTPERIRLLVFILSRPHEEIRVRRVARELDLSPGHVSRFLKILGGEAIIVENRVDLTNPLVKALKILVNIKVLGDIVPMIKSSISGVRGIGVYGSWSDGMNYSDSDLDLWIKVDRLPGGELLADLEGMLRECLEVDVSLLVLTPEKLERLRGSDKVFYYALVNSVSLWGERVDQP